MTDRRTIAVETSCRRGSIALGAGRDLVAMEHFAADMQHARELLPTADRLCRNAGWSARSFDRCFVSIGPGSFTGLRVAVTFARHMAMASNVEVLPVPTLDVIAANCADLDRPPKHVAAILDAKRGQVYAAMFRHTPEGYERISEAGLTTVASLVERAPTPLSVVGEGIDYHHEALEAAGVTICDRSLWTPSAARVLELGVGPADRDEFVPAGDLVPLYLRRPEAEEIWDKRHGADASGRGPEQRSRGPGDRPAGDRDHPRPAG